jgi:two-component system, OmpR family, heavy metal sensor histidine kinase CusS
MRPLPITIRLSLWYFMMFATAACLLNVASWWMLGRSLDSTEYHDLQERAEDVQLLLSHEDPQKGVAQIGQDLAAIYSLKDDGKWMQIMDQDGNWIYRSRRMAEQNPELLLPNRLPGHGIIAHFHQGTRYVRILSYPIVARGRAYSVQTGVALNKSMALMSSFTTRLVLLTPAVILLAALGGHWMSRRALGPVAQLAAEARRINDRNLDIRLPVTEAHDEISDLSRTLNEMLERIDNAFASVRAFTGNASHELRTPITLLRTEIEVALFRPREGDEYRTILTRLHKETIRMSTLVENLLSIARADAGAEKAVMQPIDVNHLLRRLNQDWKTVMELSLLDFRTEARGQDLVTLGDPASLTRLLSILLDNARKYTPPRGSVVVTAASEGTRIRFSVRDSGIGISTKDLPHIFERFYRGEQGIMAESRGSGLGLALGKWIAERHGAQLLVESEPGRGSEFSCSMPRADPPLRDEPLLATSNSERKLSNALVAE